MEKDIEEIITSQKNKRFLAYFRYSHPVVVLHLNYEAETVDERYALERFIVRVLDNLSVKKKVFPTAAIAHLCGVDLPVINQIIRDMSDKALITADQFGIYKVLESTKKQYLGNKKPRKSYDRDFVIDSIKRDTLPLQVYKTMHGSSRIFRYKPDDEVDSVGMTSDECRLYENKLERESAKRKESLGFPADADKFCIKNTTTAQLPDFYVVFFTSDGKLTKQLYYRNKLIDSSFADIGALKFGLKCDGGKFVRINNMPDDQMYDGKRADIGSVLAEDFKSDSSYEFEIIDAVQNIVAITFDFISKLKDKSGIFECLAKGYKDCVVCHEQSNCGEVRIYLTCGDEKTRIMLQFYKTIRTRRSKEHIVSVAQELNLSWRKALLDTGYYKLLEDIDIKDYILEQ